MFRADREKRRPVCQGLRGAGLHQLSGSQGWGDDEQGDFPLQRSDGAMPVLLRRAGTIVEYKK